MLGQENEHDRRSDNRLVQPRDVIEERIDETLVVQPSS